MAVPRLAYAPRLLETMEVTHAEQQAPGDVCGDRPGVLQPVHDRL